VKSLGEAEVNKLYKDAVYWHLIGEGYSEFEAEVEAARRVARRSKA
jgi:hypothetical protein